MCVYTHASRSEYQQLEGGCSLGCSHVKVLPTGETESPGTNHRVDQVFKASYWRDPYCRHGYLCIYFPLISFLPEQSEKVTGWGHWCCLCWSRWWVCLSVLSCVASRVLLCAWRGCGSLTSTALLDLVTPDNLEGKYNFLSSFCLIPWVIFCSS